MSSVRKTDKVVLNQGEINACKHHAKQREAVLREDGVPDKKVGKQSGAKADLDGFGAEMAVAKFLNVYPQFALTQGKRDADLWVTYNQQQVFSVDVKQTVYASGKLIAPNWKTLENADIYVLVTGEMPEFTIVGWAWAKDLIQKENLRDMGYGKQGLAYSLTQQQLREFTDTKEIIRDHHGDR